MGDFIGALDDPVLKEELTGALNGKGAFKRFKSVLIGYPKERKKWHGYNAAAMKKVITVWLNSLGIEPERISQKKKKREEGDVRKTEL
jgi:hypothetical protein